MKIAVIGTGYVGVIAGVGFANSGNEVYCVDKRQEIIDTLNSGKPTIYEQGLSELLDRLVKSEDTTLHFTTDFEKAVANSDIILIAVGTPMSEDGSADLSAVRAVAKSIGEVVAKHGGYKVIVTKSTVPVGTGDMITQIVSEIVGDVEFDVVSNPEFLKEGSALEDFLKPDRVIIGIGEESQKKEELIEMFTELYAPFMRKSNRMIFMNRQSAELTKYAANAMLATRISFMNEMSQLAETVGADISDIRKGIGSDERIGDAFLFAGPGYGGSCFPKDVQAVVKTANDKGVELKVISAVQDANLAQRDFILGKILDNYDGDVSGKTFLLWGLAFKANTDDVRMSPALFVAEKLVSMGAKVIGYDPEAIETTKRELGDSITYAHSPYECVDQSDALVILTEWSVFRTPDFDKLNGLKDKIIFDMRNLYSLSAVEKTGLSYVSIGRRRVG